MVSTSNKRSLRIRIGPHDYGPREWGVFFYPPPPRLHACTAGCGSRRAAPLQHCAPHANLHPFTRTPLHPLPIKSTAPALAAASNHTHASQNTTLHHQSLSSRTRSRRITDSLVSPPEARSNAPRLRMCVRAIPLRHLLFPHRQFASLHFACRFTGAAPPPIARLLAAGAAAGAGALAERFGALPPPPLPPLVSH